MKKIIGIGVMLETATGTFLFQERDNCTNINPSKIAPFGGEIEDNEDVYQCAKRELFEELFLEIEIDELEMIDVFESHNKSGSYIQMFLLKEVNPSYIKINEGKAIIELSAIDALNNEKVTDFTKEVFVYLDNKKGRQCKAPEGD